jgi:hypothetical protein
MSSDAVRYAPESETIDSNIDELLAQIIDFVERMGREAPRTESPGRAVRAAYAKSKAELEILADVHRGTRVIGRKLSTRHREEIQHVDDRRGNA